MGGNTGDNLLAFSLLADDNAAITSPTTLVSLTNANTNTGPVTAVLPEVFSFTPTSAAFVRLSFAGNGGTIAGFGEAAFEVQSADAATPEPASLVLFGSGLLGLVGYRWRRRDRSATKTG